MFYHGKTEYDGCRCLHDMLDLEGKNRIFKPYVADYKMNLVTLDNLDEEKLETGLRELVGFLKCRQDKEAMKAYRKEHEDRIQSLDEDTFTAISVMTDYKGFCTRKGKIKRKKEGADLMAEINAIEHKPIYMSDYVEQLDSVLSSGNRKLLAGSGKISYDEAMKKAKEEYRKYQAVTLSPIEQAYMEMIKDVNKSAKKGTWK